MLKLQDICASFWSLVPRADLVHHHSLFLLQGMRWSVTCISCLWNVSTEERFWVSHLLVFRLWFSVLWHIVLYVDMRILEEPVAPIFRIETNEARMWPGYTGRSHSMPRLCSWRTLCKLNANFPFKAVYFLGAKGLTTSSFMVYDYSTSGHTEL